MNSKPRTRSRRAPKSPVVRPLDSAELPDSPELDDPHLGPYVVVSQRRERGKRTREQPVHEEPVREEPELEEMSPVVPLLFLVVPLVLVILYGALSTWLDF